LWEEVTARLSWSPGTLRWDGHVQDHWADPACTVAHACGYPVATQLVQHAVVGAFALRLPGADGHRYRSVLVTRDGGPRLAASSDDSLSGWISARAALGVDPADVTFTGSHAASLALIASGAADMAMVDPLTLAHLRRLEPQLTEGLIELDHGPWIPGPPVVVRAATPAVGVDELRVAFADALGGDETVRSTLLLDGFIPLERADYAAVLDLVP
jgi:ABC-type phosphate/phosphonate transport system substrate-binding protein